MFWLIFITICMIVNASLTLYLFFINKRNQELEQLVICVYPDCNFMFSCNDHDIAVWIKDAHTKYHQTGECVVFNAPNS